jgi:hypothetical protein
VGSVRSLLLLLLFFLLNSALPTYPTGTESYVRTRKIDENLHNSTIHPFQDELIKLFNDTDHLVAEPFHFWFRCIGREVRAYLFIEDLRKLAHGKEADMSIQPHLSRLTFSANGEKIEQTEYWFGGGNLYFNISSELSTTDIVDVTIVGFRHFARFPVSICSPALREEDQQKHTKYLMHIHTREFHNATDFNRKIIRGMVKHMLYHHCALKLDQYEVVIQAEQLPIYLADVDIMNAMKTKWLTFILRNPFNPEPINMYGADGSHSNVYRQAYTENLNLLHYWKQNVKIYYFDSDEYLWISNDLSSQSFFQLLQSHPVLGFKRYMTFCYDCNHRVAELKSLSFHSAENDNAVVAGGGSEDKLHRNDRQRYRQHKHHVYKVIEPHLDDPKLVVNPNAVGCYIVHWAGCGASPYDVPPESMFITHFENLYVVRWKEVNEEYLKPHRFLQFTNVYQICDPSKFHWDMEKYPSYHDEQISTLQIN